MNSNIMFLLLTTLFIGLVTDNTQAGVSLSSPVTTQEGNLLEAFLRQDVQPSRPEEREFLKSIPIDIPTFLSVQRIVTDRRTTLGLKGSIPLVLHFAPMKTRVHQSAPLYLEIDRKGLAHLFLEDPTSSAVEGQFIDRGDLSKNMQDAMDRISVLEAELSQMREDLKQNNEDIVKRIDDKYATVSFSLTALYAILGLLVAIGIVNLVLNRLPRRRRSKQSDPKVQETQQAP